MQEPYEIHWKDYYKILQVNVNATEEEIKKNYRQLSKQYHPDYNEGTEEKFKELNEAYSILSDTAKRQRYNYFYNYKYNQPNKAVNNNNYYYKYFRFEQEMMRDFSLTLELSRLRDELLKHKFKQAMGSICLSSGIIFNLASLPNYINKIKNKTEIPKSLMFFGTLYGLTSLGGLYLLYKESKFDTTAHLQKMSMIEQELKKTLRF